MNNQILMDEYVYIPNFVLIFFRILLIAPAFCYLHNSFLLAKNYLRTFYVISGDFLRNAIAVTRMRKMAI